MVSFFSQWYKKNFSDPSAVTLVIILIFSFLGVYFFSHLLMPVLVAIAIAFLLDLPTNKLQQHGVSRGLSTTIVVTLFVGAALMTALGLFPTIWQQSSNLLEEAPNMFQSGQSYLSTLPDKYPELVKAEQIETLITLVNEKVLEWGQVAVKASLNSISDLVALLIYLILVPIMVFFFLKDKKELMTSFSSILPEERRMATQVGKEMHTQIMNYIRGKVIEILIIGGITTITFMALDLNYALLLGVLVGLSVLVPYVGATIVTFPVMLVALFQWGVGPEFGYVMLAYGIIQALDGNLLVPLLFSEAVNLHPVTIIIAVIVFGGLWGFWGVFFAIPLATLVKAIINAWSTSQPEYLLEK